MYLHEERYTHLFIAKEVKCSEARVSKVLIEYSMSKKKLKSDQKPINSGRDEKKLKIVKKYYFHSVKYLQRK